MPPEHARAGIAHHRLDLRAPFGLVAMDRALGTDGFLRSESTPLQPDGGVIQQVPALRAKSTVGMMMALAVTANHRRQGLPFPGQPLAGNAPANGLAFVRGWPQVRRFDGFHNCHHHRQFRSGPAKPP